VGAAEEQGGTGTYSTTDFATGTAAGKALTITFFPKVSVPQADWDKIWRDDNGFQPVDGLGDSAWYQGALLNVWAGGATVSLSIVSLQTEPTVDQLVPLARQAVSRV
jgi:hypothetical protein